MTADMTSTVEPSAAQGDGPSSESEPPRTCAEISVEDRRWDALEGFLPLVPRLVAAALQAVERAPETHAVSIALLSDAEIRSLNKAFRGKDCPTNVLSFPTPPVSPLLTGQGGQVFLGDVALAYETIAAEASEQDKPVFHHAAHLVVHGVLHLAGLDHGTAADAERMEAAERLILGKFGIPDPYGDDPAALAASH